MNKESKLASETLALCQSLIARASVTPDDAGCQALLATELTRMGFTCQTLQYENVTNLWASYYPSEPQRPRLVFAGHTDVVPPGPLDQWHTPPFEPTLKDNKLYGRGASDMKTSLAAMVVACRDFLQEHPIPAADIAFLITSDEEGPAINGTRKVVEYLIKNNINVNWCLVGEPSSTDYTGDVIRNGRRGSLTGYFTINGIQGHVAYPHLAQNPLHAFAGALNELVNIEWDQGNEFFPATSMQIVDLHMGHGITNVIPGEMSLILNFRFCTETNEADLKQRVESLFKQHQLTFTANWQLSGNPFLTPRGTLVDAVCAGIEAVTGQHPVLSTGGGTSDGRFIAPMGSQVVEVGPPNHTIHKVNEYIALSDLEQLVSIYRRILDKLLGGLFHV